MTTRFPLIFDSSDSQLKELPAGDNLDLSDSGIVNALAISSQSITTDTINAGNLSTVAFTNNYNDLDGLPPGFTGSYEDLSDKPTIVSSTRDLTDVLNTEPSDQQALLYNAADGNFVPGDVVTEIDLEEFEIGNLGNVITVGNVTDRFLKFTAGAWRPSKVQYSEVQDKPANISFFTNDEGYLTQETLEETEIRTDLVGSVFADDSTLIIDAVNNKIIGDLTGSVFSDDSTLLVDSVSGVILGPVDTDSVTNSQGNLTITADNYLIIDSTNNGQIEIGRNSGLGDVILGNTSNSTDVQIEGRMFIRGGGVPTTSVGSDGDFEGIFAVDNDYIYYCTATFDGSTDIWKRVAWSGDTW